MFAFRELSHPMRLFHKPDKLFLHIVVYVAVSRECPAAFFVAAQRTDEIRVFHLLVKVAYECAPGKVTACYLVYRTLLLLPGGGVENRYDSRYPTLLKYLLDGHVVFLRAYERQDPPLAVLSLVAFENILCPLGKWHTYHIRTLPLGLCWLYTPTASFIMLAGVRRIRSDMRQPMQQWNMKMSRWTASDLLADRSKSAMRSRSSRVM